MSKPYIETDAVRAARAAATVTIGHDAHGNTVVAQMVIDPSGHLVQVKDGTRLKDGYRYATRADVQAKQEAELERQTLEADAPSAA